MSSLRGRPTTIVLGGVPVPAWYAPAEMLGMLTLTVPPATDADAPPPQADGLPLIVVPAGIGERDL